MNSEAATPLDPDKTVSVPSRKPRLPRETGILGALVLMLAVVAVFIPQFRDIQNLTNITRNFSFVGIVAMGMTLVILTGGIDLSVGSVWGMTAVVMAFHLTQSMKQSRLIRL
jgi:ribose transport system permease protein